MRIRNATLDDAGRMLEIYAPIIEQTVISFEATPPTVAEFAGRIEHHMQTHPWLVAEIDGAIAGYAYGGLHRSRAAYQWSAEVSVYVSDRHRRMGVARTLYEKLLDLLRVQGFVNVYAGATLPNDASVALHKSFGFEDVGTYRNVGFKFGKWHSVLWMELAIGKHSSDLPDPKLPHEIDTESWNKVLITK